MLNIVGQTVGIFVTRLFLELGITQGKTASVCMPTIGGFGPNPPLTPQRIINSRILIELVFYNY